MKILIIVALVLFFISKPHFLIKILKNSFLLVTFAIVIFLIVCSCSSLTNISSSVIPKTNVSLYGNHASINTPYGNIGAKLPSPTKSIESQTTIVGHYCKNHTKNRFRCLQISTSSKEKYYNVFLIQNKSNSLDTLAKNYDLSLQKFADRIYLLKDKTIVTTIKNGRATFKNESFKYSNNWTYDRTENKICTYFLH